MKYFLYPGLIFSVITVMGRAQSQPSIEIDSASMLIGDQSIIRLTVIDPAGPIDTVLLSGWISNQDLEILAFSPWDSVLENDELMLKRYYTITVFDTGYIKLAPLKILLKRNGEIDTLLTNDLALTVRGVQVDSLGLAPIKYIIREPARLSDYWIAILVLIMTVTGTVIWNFYRKRARIPEDTPEPMLPPHEVAIEKLKVLAKEKLWQQGLVKKYQSELTFIIREYLEGRFQILALEMTTGEILQALRGLEIEPSELKNLDEILNIADLVKFAKARPDLDIHQQFLIKAKQFILSTAFVESEDKITG